MFLSVFLMIALFGFLCWLLFNLAVYALPFFAAVTAGMFAYDTGSGPILAGVVGVIAGTVTFVVGQALFATARSPALRTALVIIFASPAAVAGYYSMHGVSELGVPSDNWRQVVSIIAGAVTGVIAWSRLGALAPARSLQDVNSAAPQAR